MDIFAKYYDMMVGADYDKISSFIVSCIKKFKPDSELVCDLGCGTGIVASKLSLAGFDMIAIDSDEDMLAKAGDNIKELGADNVLLLNQDITEFELYGTVDVIYSTLDTLNYITDKRKIDKLFKLVKNYLNYNGLFIFDINSEYKFESILANNDFIYDEEDLFCCWSANYDSKTKKCYHYLTYFEKLDNGLFFKKENEQIQRFYSEEFLIDLFRKYGFDILKRADNYNNCNPNEKTQRITYVLKINK